MGISVPLLCWRMLVLSSILHCLRLAAVCTLCTTCNPQGCKGCKLNARYLNKFDCVCDSRSYAFGSQCNRCDPHCSSCTGGPTDQCATCSANMDGPIGGICTCKPMFQWNNAQALCLSTCHATCKTCEDTTSSGCLSCYNGASLSGGVCMCVPGYVAAPDASNCALCSTTCLTCVDTDSSSCTGCFDNAKLDQGASPAACVCFSGYFPNPTSDNCLLCDPNCAECISELVTDCTLCNIHAELQGSPPNACACVTGWFPDPDASHCSIICGSECQKCDVNGCLSCFANAKLSGIAPIIKCECKVGYYPTPNASNCLVCASACATCSAAGLANSCLTCFSNAHLSGSAPSTCECNSYAYTLSDASACQLCDRGCLTCSGGSASSCLSCKVHSTLSSSKCICEVSYFPNTITGECHPCSSKCKSCVDETDSGCLSCHESAHILVSLPGPCICITGFYWNTATQTCQMCSNGCSVCNSEVCYSCFTGYYRMGRACVQTCPFGLIEDTVSGECVESSSHSHIGVTLTGEVTPANDVILTFSEPIQPLPRASDFYISLIDTDEKPYPFTADLSLLIANSTFRLAITVANGYLPGANELYVSVLAPDTFTDALGHSVSSSLVNLTLHSIGEKPIKNTKQAHTSRVSLALTATATSNIVACLMAGSSFFLFTFVNNIQLITYFPLSSIPLPEMVKTLMISLNLQNYLKMPLSSDITVKDLEILPPSFAQEYGFTTTSFLPNALTILLTMLFNIGCFGTSWLLSKCKHPQIRAHGIKWVSGYRWENLGMHWVLSYLDISIFAYLCVQQLAFDSPISTADSVLAYCVAALNSVVPFALLYFTFRYAIFIVSRHFWPINSWKFLYEGQKNNKGAGSCLYYPLFVLRRLIYALTLVFLSDFPLVQSVIIHLHSLFTVLFLLIYRPFLDKLEGITVTLSEVAICVTLSLPIAYNFDLSTSSRMFITVGIAAGVIAAIVIPLISSCIELLFKLMELLKRRKRSAVGDSAEVNSK